MNDQEILKIIQSMLKSKKVTSDMNLRDLGIDSLDLLDLILEIEEKYKITVDDEELLKMDTIQDVIQIVKKKL